MRNKNEATRSTQSRLFTESGQLNNKEHTQYFNRLTELSISMFEWKNLPDTIDSRFLELALFNDGMAVFFKDDVMGYLCLRTMIGGRLTVYQVPIERTAYASNGYNMHLDNTNSVIIWNNLIRTPSMLDVDVFAKRLYNLDRIIEVNANAQKTPILVKCDEKQKLTMHNLYMKYEGNEPYIFGDKSLNDKGLQVLRTDAPYIADKIYELKMQYWNEALTYLGISSVNNVKKERLITDEVTRNAGGTIASRYSRLTARQNACKEINEMFGLNISVDFKQDINPIMDELYEPAVKDETKGGEEDE